MSVSELIDDIGKSATLRTVSSSYSASTGAVSKTTNDVSVTAMFLNYKNSEFNDSVIKQGDVKIVIDADSVNIPETNDIVLDGSIEYRLVSVQKIEMDHSNLVYLCQGRKQ